MVRTTHPSVEIKYAIEKATVVMRRKKRPVALKSAIM